MEHQEYQNVCDMNSGTCRPKKEKNKSANGASCGLYGMGLIGALVYYIQHATSVWTGMLGLLKALVWPAMVVYKMLEFLGM